MSGRIPTATIADAAVDPPERPARPAGYARVLWALLLVGFVGLNAFWQFLAGGTWFEFTPSGFREAISYPVGRILDGPLDVFAHPWMIVISGLVWGMAAVVPLIAAVRRRVLLTGALILVVALVGRAPLLAGVLVLGCLLAGRTSLRDDAPFLAVLLGMTPVVLYLVLSALVGREAAALLPLQRWVRTLPFLLAVVWAVLVAAAVLGVGSLLRFHPLVVWLPMVVLLGLPVWVFFDRIGSDELSYAMIRARLGPGDVIFAPRRLDAYRGREEMTGLNEQTLRIRIREGLEARRAELMVCCEAFLRKFPQSPRAASVLWVEAQCSSLQLDERALRNGQIRYTGRYPLPRSAPLWQRLNQEYPRTPQADLSRWRLGELALRRGEVRRADELLVAARDSLAARLESAGRPTVEWTGRVFVHPGAPPGEAYCEAALFEVRCLVWLIEQNDLVGETRAAEAAAAYMRLNPNRVDYPARLAGLLDDPERQFETTTMGDNLKLAVAKANPNIFERAAMLVSLAGELNDAAIQANYELGWLVLAEPVLRLEPGIEDAATYFKRVEQAPPNPYARPATAQLARLTGSPLAAGP